MTTLREQNMKHKGIIKRNQRPKSLITDPYEKFWPLLNSDKSQLLIDTMEKTISKENGKLKVNWFTLKKLPLDVRKCQIKDFANKHKHISSALKAQRLILKIGINEVSRCIEKNQIVCCLIAEDVANCMIAKHLLYMTAAKKIPVIILPDMHSITKRILGFSSAALGLKKDVLVKLESSLYNLYQTIVQLSNQFKNPYLKHTTKKESKAVKNSTNLNICIENYLLKKPREGRAFIPKDASSNKTLNDLSFIPIEKMIIENQKPHEQNEELFEIPTCNNLFNIDTTPLHIEDIGEFVERRTQTKRQPLRYYGLNIKKMKPNPNRKLKKEHDTNKQQK